MTSLVPNMASKLRYLASASVAVGGPALWRVAAKSDGDQGESLQRISMPDKDYTYDDHDLIVFKNGDTRQGIMNGYQKELRLRIGVGMLVSSGIIYAARGSTGGRIAGVMLLATSIGGLAVFDWMMKHIVTGARFNPNDLSVEFNKDLRIFPSVTKYNIKDLKPCSLDTAKSVDEDGTIEFEVENDDGILNYYAILPPEDYGSLSMRFTNRDMLIDIARGDINEVLKYKFVPNKSDSGK